MANSQVSILITKYKGSIAKPAPSIPVSLYLYSPPSSLVNKYYIGEIILFFSFGIYCKTKNINLLVTRGTEENILRFQLMSLTDI